MGTIYACGAECLSTITNGLNATGALAHWNQTGGTLNTDWAFESVKVAPTGSTQSLKHIAVASSVQWNVQCPTFGNVNVGRCYIMFETLGSTLTPIHNVLIGGHPGVGVTAANKFCMIGNAGTALITGADTIVVGRWYRLDWRVDSSANPWKFDLMVDGVPQGAATEANAAANASALEWGNRSSMTSTFYIDDIVYANAATDYPIGPGCVLPIQPVSDGIHSFTAGDFKYGSGTNIATTATDVFSWLNHFTNQGASPSTQSINQAVIRTTGYVEVRLGGLPFLLPGGRAYDVLGVEFIGCHHNTSGTTANTISHKWEQATGDTFIVNATTIRSASPVTQSKHSSTRGDGKAWTTGDVQAITSRWGFSSDVAPVPNCDGILAEVVCRPKLTSNLLQVV